MIAVLDRKGKRILIAIRGRESIENIFTDFFPEIKKDIIDIPIICNSIPYPLHLRVFLFPSHPKLRTILFPSPPKLRAILFLFHADLRARSTTFSRKWLKSLNWEVNIKHYHPFLGRFTEVPLLNPFP